MILGVVGLISSGKGTVGDILVEDHGYIKESFAKPLKDAAALIFNWPRHMLEGDTKESRDWREVEDPFWSKKLNKRVTPRLVLQWLGTEAGRNVFGEQLWSASLQNRVDPNKNYVITDVRFENEIKAIREMNGLIIRVKRGDDPHWLTNIAVEAKKQNKEKLTQIDQTAPDIHISEWDWCTSKMDAILLNNSTLDELRDNVKILTRFK